ncbi:MAG: hypothetical protein IJV40_08925 [Oscillospiraceae bacterium]|nr:hypothetical protein [Oscillospiraceae bacterium]
MKKFFSNPVVAVLLTVVVVIGSVVLNTRTRLGKQCEAVSGLFYSPDRASEASIADSLRTLCNASEQLVLLGVKYDVDDAEEAMDALDEIRDAIRNQSRDMDNLFEEYQDLLKDTFSLESALSRMTLSEADEASYASAQHAASDAKAAIDSSSYNDTVRGFLKRYHQFPTPQIAKLSGVTLPTLFA